MKFSRFYYKKIGYGGNYAQSGGPSLEVGTLVSAVAQVGDSHGQSQGGYSQDYNNYANSHQSYSNGGGLDASAIVSAIAGNDESQAHAPQQQQQSIDYTSGYSQPSYSSGGFVGSHSFGGSASYQTTSYAADHNNYNSISPGYAHGGQDIYSGPDSYKAPPSGLIGGDNVQTVSVASESSGYNYPKPEHGLHH